MSGFSFGGGFPGHGSHGFPPGGGFPGHGSPGFPPGGGFPGHGSHGFPPGGGFPGHGSPGFPPGGGFPGHGSPGFPPGGGFPGHGSPGFPPGGGSSGQHQGPTSPPPNMTPPYPDNKSTGPQLRAVDPGAIGGCMYRNTYVWLSRREGFWFYPTFVGRTSVAGFRWNNRRRRWEYLGVDLDRIDSFTCF
nr:hypothetical protein [Filibacter tadaridae]